MKHLRSIFLIFMAIAPQAHAEETLQLVTSNGYEPFTDEKLPGKGLFTEIVETVFQKAKLKYNLRWVPWARCESGTANNAYDATFPYGFTAEREQKFLFSAAVFTLNDMIMVRKGEKFDYLKPETLRGKVLCRANGYGLNALVQGFVDKGILKLDRPSDIDSCLRMLAAGRVDMVSEAGLVDRYLQKKVFGNSEKFSLLPFSSESFTLHLIVAKHNPKAQMILEAFNKGLAALQRSGEFKAIVDKHLK